MLNWILKNGDYMLIPFGEKLSKLRYAKQLSHAQLAKKVGVSTSIIALYETGARLPSLPTFVQIAKSLGVSTDFLVGMDDYWEDTINVSGLWPEQRKLLEALNEQFKTLIKTKNSQCI